VDGCGPGDQDDYPYHAGFPIFDTQIKNRLSHRVATSIRSITGDNH
jgi:hypothetical protein